MSSLSSPLRRRTRLWIFASAGVILAVSCTKSSSTTDDELEPPVLELLSAQNTLGEVFELSDPIGVVGCDPRLTLNLGPSTIGAGLLDNWSLRAPGTCSDKSTQCGFIKTELFSVDEKLLLGREQAVLNPVLDLSSVDLAEVHQVSVTLIDGHTSEPFLLDDQEVVATAEITLESSPCGMGGAGGGPMDPPMGGSDGSGGTPSTGGTPSPGGQGGALL